MAEVGEEEAAVAETTATIMPARKIRAAVHPPPNNLPRKRLGQGSSTTRITPRNQPSMPNDEAAATHPHSPGHDLVPLERRTSSSAHPGAQTAAEEEASASHGAGLEELELLIALLRDSQYPKGHLIEQPSTIRHQSCPPTGRPVPCP